MAEAAPAKYLPESSLRFRRWFTRYLRHYFARHFNGVRLSKSSWHPDRDTDSFVVYANHPSWWDPILMILAAELQWPRRRSYGPMDADALEKYRIFKRLGVFGVERGSHRGAVAFLRTAEAVLGQHGSVLWITAEGNFTDPRHRPVQLQFGLPHLLRRRPALQAVPLAIEYPFWNERLPEALLRFGAPISAQDVGSSQVADLKHHLESRLEATMDDLALEASARNPDDFETLVLGQAGVGGIYDTWRRLRGALTSRSVTLSHEERRR